MFTNNHIFSIKILNANKLRVEGQQLRLVKLGRKVFFNKLEIEITLITSKLFDRRTRKQSCK